jgi:hypothetical protein
MSALPPKADINPHKPECLLLAETVEKVRVALLQGTCLENDSLSQIILEGHSDNLRIEESDCLNFLMQN